MAFLRSAATTTTAAAAIAAALAFTSPSSTSSSSPFFHLPKTLKFSPLSANSIVTPVNHLGLAKTLKNPPSALHMDVPTSDYRPSHQKGDVLPELLTEFMLDMKCEGCVMAFKNKLQTVNGVKNVEADLSNQVVRVLGSSPVKTLCEALEQMGRKARLIGQGVPEVNMELARIEANFSGLPAGKCGWSMNEYGNLTKGVASTGKVFNPTTEEKEPLGDLGTLDVDENGEAFFSGTKKGLKVADLIERSIAIYGTIDKSDPGLMAAVIARSAGVGENYKKLCTCDGTTIWEASNADFVTSKV